MRPTVIIRPPFVRAQLSRAGVDYRGVTNFGASEHMERVPAHVAEALDSAGAVLQELADQGFDVRLEVDDARSRVCVEVRDLSGRVVRELSPLGMLDLLVGAVR